MFAEILKSVESETALVLEENAYLGKRRTCNWEKGGRVLGKRRKRTWEKGGRVPGEKDAWVRRKQGKADVAMIF